MKITGKSTMEIPSEPTKTKPMLYLNEKDYPDTVDFEAGEKVEMTIKGTITSKRDSERKEKGKVIKTCSIDIEIDEIIPQDEITQSADKAKLSRKDYKNLMKKRQENKEKIENEKS